MSTAAAPTQTAELDDAARAAVRQLILVLADSKRLLGTRYAAWILGAPELESGIACASMAQDEWGHGRLLYALLKDFGDDVDRLEHAREPEEYCSMDVLDRSPESWPHVVVLNAFADAALTFQLDALRESAYAPLRQRVGKLLDEEHFHLAHGAAWFRRLAESGDAGRDALRASVTAQLPRILRWFGSDAQTKQLQEAGIVRESADQLRRRLLERTAPLLELVGLGAVEPAPMDNNFDEQRRRRTDSAPDATTIGKVRGDKNRMFLMD